MVRSDFIFTVLLGGNLYLPIPTLVDFYCPKDFLAFLRTTYATATTAPASLALEPVSMSLRRLSSDRGRSMSRGSSGGAPVPAQQQLQLPESGARDKILQALGKMNRQIDGMRAEFVRGVEKKCKYLGGCFWVRKFERDLKGLLIYILDRHNITLLMQTFRIVCCQIVRSRRTTTAGRGAIRT